VKPDLPRRTRTPSADLPQAILIAPTDGGLALARSLSRRGVRVSLLAEKPWRWVLSTRWGDGYELGQLPQAEGEWLEVLESLAEHGDGVLIPCTDRTCELVIRERGRIPENLRSFEGPDSAHLALMDKDSLYEIADRAGIRYPWTLRLSSLEQLDALAAEATYPCLLKPVISHHWRRLFGERRVLPVRDPDELARLATPALEADLSLLVTEHIPGPDSNIEGAASVRRADGTYAFQYGRRKLRQFPPGAGAGSLFVSNWEPDTMELADKLLSAPGYVGMSVVEAKRHDESGEMVLIEANVRVPQSFAVGDAAGTGASWRLYATLAEIPLAPQPAPIDGVKVLLPSMEPRAAVSNVQQGLTTAGAVLASYRGVRSLSGLSLSDPRPAFGLALDHLRPATRALTRFRRDGDRDMERSTPPSAA
jgi:D-aspartate ligase